MGARAPTKGKIKESLEQQLREKGADTECFRDDLRLYVAL